MLPTVVEPSWLHIGVAAAGKLEDNAMPGIRGWGKTAHDHVVAVGDVTRLRVDLRCRGRRRRRSECLAGGHERGCQSWDSDHQRAYAQPTAARVVHG